MLFVSKTRLWVLTTHKASLPSQLPYHLSWCTDVHLRYLAAYEIAKVVTKKAALALRPFHVFTGCDMVNTSSHLQK